MKYLEEIKKFIGTHVKYDEYGGGYIWGYHNDELKMIAEIDIQDHTEKENSPIVSVRGWGAIQHLFPTYEEQEEFQDELGKFIAEAINEKINKK